MKKFSLVSLVAALLGFASCSSDSSMTMDQLGLYPIVSNGYQYVYADQTVDSVTVVATQPFTLKIDGNPQWMSLSKDQGRWNWSAHAAENRQLFLYFTPNTTNEVRTTIIRLSDAVYSVGRPVIQTYWLNVTTPQAAFTNKESMQGVYFMQTVDRDSTSTQFNFNIHEASAVLTTASDWVEPSRYVAKKGANTVNLTFEKNTTGNDRDAVYELMTESDITTKITLRQSK